MPTEDQQIMFPDSQGHQIDPSQPEAPESEVDFTPGADFDQLSETKTPEAQEPVDQAKLDREILDTIVTSKEPRTWIIGPEDMQHTYVQRELSFIAKMQWFSLVGEVIDKALSGPNGMSLNSLFSRPGTGGTFRMEDFRDADLFVQAISKLLAAAPDFLIDSYLIWLNVPDFDRPIARDIMKLPPSEGGLSDEQGIGIIETFLDQNFDALADFFSEGLGQLQARITKLSENRESRRSKR